MEIVATVVMPYGRKRLARSHSRGNRSSRYRAGEIIWRLQIDLDRSGGDLTKIPGMEPPFQAATVSTFEPPVDDGLLARCDRERRWVNALWWENTTHISNHHPADCLHSFVNLGPLAPHSKKALRGRIYWAKITKDELLARWRREFSGR